MCAIVGIQATRPVSLLLHSALISLQHRGQDAAGIITEDQGKFYSKKGLGLVKAVFSNNDISELFGNSGIAHLRYPTSGTFDALNEIQPLYVNAPFGITLSHNGNITNCEVLKASIQQNLPRHLNTENDSEVIINYLAYQLQKYCKLPSLTPDDLWWAVSNLFREARGGYSIIVQIADKGMIAIRDPNGIRPLIYGSKKTEKGTEYIIASESVAIDILGYTVERDVAPGEMIYFQSNQKPISYTYKNQTLLPCLFEFVYLARPDSTIDGISVYTARMEMGLALANKVKKSLPNEKIDVVIPIPDTSRIAAYELAMKLKINYREGFIKNRYIDRTFIMPKQLSREISVKHKLNPVKQEFYEKIVLLVDDSIVRGTTSKEIVQMAKQMGAKKVFFAVASPPVLFPNYYGIDIPSSEELIATNRTNQQIADEIGAESVIYLSLEELTDALTKLNSKIKKFEDSCFSGSYIHE
ncbi:MAG: amidophosphoribosyltransferase [Methylacidiphilales bacterium]|nr:amidophosphoribosyltransferase [Candidatus Methylacidiphilales bacterium]